MRGLCTVCPDSRWNPPHPVWVTPQAAIKVQKALRHQQVMHRISTDDPKSWLAPFPMVNSPTMATFPKPRTRPPEALLTRAPMMPS